MATANVSSKGSYRDMVKMFFGAEQSNTEKILKKELGLGEEDDLPAYQHQQYPKHLYTDADTYIEVNSKKEEDAAIAAGAFSELQHAKDAAVKAAEEQAAADQSADVLVATAAKEADAIRTNKKPAAKAAPVAPPLAQPPPPPAA